MLALIILAAALAASSPVAEESQGPGTELILQVAAKPIYPDGRQTGWAASSDRTAFTNEFVYSGAANACMVGASSNEPTRLSPGNGWRISGRVLRQVSGGLFVQLDWQRQWYQAQRLGDGLGGSTQVLLKVGEPQTLDEIYVTPSAGCDAVGVRLDASVVERPVGPPTARMSGAVTVTAGRGGPVQSNVISGAGASTLSNFGPGIVSLATPVELDLFLVHTSSDGSEDVQRIIASASPNSQFSFSPITVATSAGEATYEISGGVAAVVDASGQKQLRVLVERRITGNPAVNSRGQSVGAYLMPGPEDVYSFETPALIRNGATITADRVAIRIRLAAKRE